MSNIICIEFKADTSGRQWVSVDDLIWKLSGVKSLEDLFQENSEVTPEVETAIAVYIEKHKGDPKFAEEFCGCLNFDYLDDLVEEIEKEFDLTGLEYEEDERKDKVPQTFYMLTPVEKLKRLKNITFWGTSNLQEDNFILIDEQGNEL